MKNGQQPLHEVYLLRHGATGLNEERRICGHSEVLLSNVGRQQVARASQLLADRAVGLIVTSPLPRTLETARLVAAPHGLEPQPEEGLIELRLEGWAGKGRSELWDSDPQWRRWLTEPEATTTPEGESLADVQDRALEALRASLARLPEQGGGLVVVSHGGVLRVLLLTLLGQPLSSYHKVRMDTGSVTVISLTAEGELHCLLGMNLNSTVLR